MRNVVWLLMLLLIAGLVCASKADVPASQPATRPADPFEINVKFFGGAEVKTGISLDQPFVKRLDDAAGGYHVISGVCTINDDGTYSAKMTLVSWGDEKNNDSFGTTVKLELGKPTFTGFVSGFIHSYSVTLTRVEEKKPAK